MKKIISTILAVLSLSFIMAQSATVPTNLKKEVKDKYNVSTATWSTTSKYYVATWEANGENKTVVYSNSNEPQLVRVETDLPFNSLSSTTQNQVNTRFLGEGSQYSVRRTFKVDSFGAAIEGVQFDMTTNDGIRTLYIFFDANGNMTSRELN